LPPSPSRSHTDTLERIAAEARGEIEWFEARQNRNLEVRERLKWTRRCLRLLDERAALLADLQRKDEEIAELRTKIGELDPGAGTEWER